MNIKQFRDTIYDFAVGAIDDPAVTVTHGHQPDRSDSQVAAPTPERPFVSIELGNRDRIGTDSHWMDSETQRFVSDIEQSVTFRIFGGVTIEAQDLSDAIEQGFEHFTTREILTDAGIGMSNIDNMIAQHAVQGSGWENRAHIDATFRYDLEHTDDPSVIDQVDITGTLQPGSDDTSQSIDMEYA